VPQGLLHRDSARRVELQHLHAEVEGHLVHELEVGFWVYSLEFGEGRLKVGEVI
jgi:hypothetical protein